MVAIISVFRRGRPATLDSRRRPASHVAMLHPGHIAALTRATVKAHVAPIRRVTIPSPTFSQATPAWIGQVAQPPIPRTVRQLGSDAESRPGGGAAVRIRRAYRRGSFKDAGKRPPELANEP